MQTSKIFIFILALLFIASCKKSNIINPTQAPTPSENYYSVNDFFTRNGPVMQTYNINSATGGSFISQQGTIVTIPANAFVALSKTALPGDVTIEFKDVYQKSDMLLSGMETTTRDGRPLKSGGEFFIRAISNNIALQLAPGKKITVEQPAEFTGGLDSLNKMPAYEGPNSTGDKRWSESLSDTVIYGTSKYIYCLYKFQDLLQSGSWCNSDNSSYFSHCLQTKLTLVPKDDIKTYNMDVFLVFKNIHSVIHIYSDGTCFPYDYAPQGLECTMVAIGVKDGNSFSCFMPVKISANQAISFSLTHTTTNEFKNTLKALN